MTGNKVIRQRIKSDSSVESIDHQTPESGNMKERAKNKEQETYIVRRKMAKMIGKAAWDKIFPGEEVDIPPKRFMERVKEAVSSLRNRLPGY